MVGCVALGFEGELDRDRVGGELLEVVWPLLEVLVDQVQQRFVRGQRVLVFLIQARETAGTFRTVNRAR